MVATKEKKTPADKSAKKAKVPDYKSPAALARYDFETQRMTREVVETVQEAENEYLSLKEQASDAKKTLEAKEIELLKLIEDRGENRGKPPKPNLFQKADNAATDKAMKDANAAAIDGDAWPPEDLWQQFPLARMTEFGLTASDVEKLAAGTMKKGIEGIGPIDTMGAMSRYTKPSANGWARKLTDIQGVGQATLDRWSEAETKFWAAWKDGLGEKFATEQGLTKPEPKEQKDADANQPADKKRRRKTGSGTEPVSEDAKPSEPDTEPASETPAAAEVPQ